MIQKALEYLSDELTAALEDLSEEFISVDSLRTLQEKSEQGIIISLINVEEEGTLKNSSHHFIKEQKAFYQTPPFSINLQLILAFDFDNYGKNLRHLSSVANFFHKKKIFSAENQEVSNPFPTDQLGGEAKLIADWRELTLEQLNQLWSMSGGVHYPALFYRIRMLQLTQKAEISANTIETIELDSESYRSTSEMQKALKEKQHNF